MSNNIFIDLTEELANKGWTVHWEFNSDIDPALLKYNNCVSYLDCREINPDVMNDLDENGTWNYRLDNLEVVSNIHEASEEEIMLQGPQGLFYSANDESITTSPIISFNADLPKVQKVGSLFFDNQNLKYIKTSLPSVISTYPDPFSKYEDSEMLLGYMLSIPLIVSQNPLSLSVDLDLPNAECIVGIMTNYLEYGPTFNFESLKINAPKLTSCSVADFIFDKLLVLTPFTFGGLGGSIVQSIEFNAPSLKDGTGLFVETRLKEFSGDLSSLLTGSAMFISCRLSLNSIRNIANCINDISEKPWDGSNLLGEYCRFISDRFSEETQITQSGEFYGQLTLGIDASLEGTVELEEALEAIRAKGWTIEEEYN